MGASGGEAREASGGGDRGQGTGGSGGVLAVAKSSEVLGAEYSVLSHGRPAVVAWAGSGDPRSMAADGEPKGSGVFGGTRSSSWQDWSPPKTPDPVSFWGQGTGDSGSML